MTLDVGTCPSCGRELPVDAPNGCCPACLYRLGFEESGGRSVSNLWAAAPDPSASAAVPDLPPNRSFGDYELLERVGHGGMGVVYKACQKSLNRIVALKLLPLGPHAPPESVKRFRAEAVSTAALQHPNIVAIHEVGFADGQPFIAMDYVEGQPLSGLIRGTLLPPRRAASYVKTIAEAIHYAHERGILHRDLKPANVLIDANDQPRVTDFGLAKQLDSASAATSVSELTVTGQVLGSPNYMPPEQAAGGGGTLTRRTDVYGLGAILYHALTGRPPYLGEGLADIVQQVLHTEPVAPRLLNGALPRDLETICLKCLEKEPAKRYPTAQALAEELGRFLRGEPILARPLGLAGKSWRWCRRNPRLAAALGATMLSLVIGLGGVSWQWQRAESERRRAEGAEISALRRSYISEINSAQAALKANNPGRALELLERQRPGAEARRKTPSVKLDLRGFEWRYLWQLCQHDADRPVANLSGKIRCLEVSADGRWLAAGSERGEAKAVDLLRGQQIRLLPDRGWTTFVAFSPDSSEVIYTDQTSSSYGTISAWNTKTGQRRTLLTNSEPVGRPLFSPDGRWLFYGKVNASFRRAAVVMDYPARIAAREMQLFTSVTDNEHGGEAAFTADSRSLVFSENDPDRRIGVWDFAAGTQPRYFPAHREAVIAIAASPDGRLLATGAGWSDRMIRLWELPSIRPLGELRGHEARITGLDFAPDGRTLASASADQTIRLWDVSKLAQTWASRRLPYEVLRVRFAPNGRTLFSGGNDGTILRWFVDVRREAHTTVQHSSGLTDLAIAPSGARFAAIRQGVVWLGDAYSGEMLRPLGELGSNNLSVRFSVDGRLLFTGSQNGDVQIWSVPSSRIEQRLHPATSPVRILMQDAAGSKLLVAQCDSSTVIQGRPCRIGLWNVADWKEQKSWVTSGYRLACAISPDGSWVATGDPWQPVQVWNVKGAGPATNPVSFSTGTVTDLAFSPNGLLLAAANEEGTVRIWELPSLGEVTVFRAHPHTVQTLAFSPDSQRLATAGDGEQAISIWEVNTWQELLILEHPGRTIKRLAFSPDGGRLFALNDQGDLLLWRVPSWGEIEASQERNPRREIPQ